MKNKSYELSSSDEEFNESRNQKSSKKTNVKNDSELLEEILENSKVSQFDFKGWKFCDTLFYDDIGDEEELWLVQCPKNTDLKALNNVNLDVDSAVSHIKCRVDGMKEKLTVYSTDDFPSQLNLALPRRSTKSFQLKVVPVAGQLILQKNIKKRKLVENSDSRNSLEDFRTKLELQSNDEPKSEVPTPKKERRR